MTQHTVPLPLFPSVSRPLLGGMPPEGWCTQPWQEQGLHSAAAGWTGDRRQLRQRVVWGGYGRQLGWENLLKMSKQKRSGGWGQGMWHWWWQKKRQAQALALVRELERRQ